MINNNVKREYFNLILKYEYKHWLNISMHEYLSEDFIREFKDKVDWYYISIYQDLSEDFIREFKNEVNWYNISVNQNLSNNFKEEFKEYL